MISFEEVARKRGELLDQWRELASGGVSADVVLEMLGTSGYAVRVGMKAVHYGHDLYIAYDKFCKEVKKHG